MVCRAPSRRWETDKMCCCLEGFIWSTVSAKLKDEKIEWLRYIFSLLKKRGWKKGWIKWSSLVQLKLAKADKVHLKAGACFSRLYVWGGHWKTFGLNSFFFNTCMYNFYNVYIFFTSEFWADINWINQSGCLMYRLLCRDVYLWFYL